MKLPRTHRLNANQKRFLEEFAKNGRVFNSLRACECQFDDLRKWMLNPTFTERFSLAKDEFKTRLHDEAVRRAVGLKLQSDEPAIRFSDDLLIYLLTEKER